MSCHRLDLALVLFLLLPQEVIQARAPCTDAKEMDAIRFTLLHFPVQTKSIVFTRTAGQVATTQIHSTEPVDIQS